MRAIVSLFKFFVGASFLISSAILAFIMGLGISGSSGAKYAALGGVGILAAFAGFLLLILMSGMSALLVSAHDRLSDMTLLMKERNEMLSGSGTVRSD